MAALMLIYDKLIAGESFGLIGKHRLGGTYFWDVLYYDRNYIQWRYYGSGANKASLENLKWILSNIFELSPEEFLYKYTTHNEWKRINNCYED